VIRLTTAILLALASIVALHSGAGVAQTPARSTQVEQGRVGYVQACAACHGQTGQGGDQFATPIWGPRSNIASKFPTGAALLDYNLVLMPFDNPGRVSDESKLAITLYMLVNHGTLPADTSVTEAQMQGVRVR
jgi:cytochrome c